MQFHRYCDSYHSTEEHEKLSRCKAMSPLPQLSPSIAAGMSDVIKFYLEMSYYCALATMSPLLSLSEHQSQSLRFRSEMIWNCCSRPYYHVYPSVIEMSRKLDLSGVKLNTIDLPSECVASGHKIDILEKAFPSGGWRGKVIELAYPVGREPGEIATVLCSVVSEMRNGSPILQLCCDKTDGNWVIGTIEMCDMDIEQYTVKYAVETQGVMRTFFDDVLRCLLTISMLSRDAFMCSRDVLSKDRDKYEIGDEETRRLIEERAKRRGKFGWTVGAKLESIPHLRRPHFAIRWTGKGGQIPQLRPVKAAVVHRKKMTEIPTGYRDDEAPVDDLT